MIDALAIQVVSADMVNSAKIYNDVININMSQSAFENVEKFYLNGNWHENYSVVNYLK